MKGPRRAMIVLMVCLGIAGRAAAQGADLQSSDPVARAAAAWELGVKGDTAAVPKLVRVLDDQTPYVVLSGLVALGNIGDESAVPAIKKAVGHDNFAVRTAAIAQLGRIGGMSVAGELLAIYKAPKSTNAKERAQEQLIAMRALKSCPDKKVIDSLIESEMKNPQVSDAVKRAICVCAGRTGDPKYAPVLKNLVNQERVLVLCGAAEGLAYLGDNAGIDRLIERLPTIKDFDEARPIRYTLKQLTGKPFWHAKHWAGWWKKNRTTFRAKRPGEQE